MARKFTELEAKMRPEARARAKARAKQMIAELLRRFITPRDSRRKN